MTTSSDRNDGKDRISCADVTLLFDEQVSGTLAEADRLAVSQHLRSCLQCSEFVQLTGGFRQFGETLSASELDVAVRRVQQQARSSSSALLQLPWYRGTTGRWIVAAAASVIAALAAVLFYASTPTPGPSDGAADFQCVAALPEEPIAGVHLTYCKGDGRPAFSVRDGGDIRVVLQHGAVGLSIDPERPNPHKVSVETRHGTVEVKGTVFTVRVDRENTWVEVFRGVVQVVPTDENAEPFTVKSGFGADVSRGKRFELSAPKTEMLRARLALSVAPSETIEAEIDTDLGDTADTDDADTGDTGPSAKGAVHRRSNTAAKQSDGMYDLIQAAQSCLIDKKWECAAEQYRLVLKRYPRRPETPAVIISLAKVELRYLGTPKDALSHYTAYQRRAPNGPLAEEALYGIAEAHRRLDDEKAETDTLRRFVERFPQSSLAGKARARLAKLEP